MTIQYWKEVVSVATGCDEKSGVKRYFAGREFVGRYPAQELYLSGPNLRRSVSLAQQIGVETDMH